MSPTFRMWTISCNLSVWLSPPMEIVSDLVSIFFDGCSFIHAIHLLGVPPKVGCFFKVFLYSFSVLCGLTIAPPPDPGSLLCDSVSSVSLPLSIFLYVLRSHVLSNYPLLDMPIDAPPPATTIALFHLARSAPSFLSIMVPPNPT